MIDLRNFWKTFAVLGVISLLGISASFAPVLAQQSNGDDTKEGLPSGRVAGGTRHHSVCLVSEI